MGHTAIDGDRPSAVLAPPCCQFRRDDDADPSAQRNFFSQFTATFSPLLPGAGMAEAARGRSGRSWCQGKCSLARFPRSPHATGHRSRQDFGAAALSRPDAFPSSTPLREQRGYAALTSVHCHGRQSAQEMGVSVNRPVARRHQTAVSSARSLCRKHHSYGGEMMQRTGWSHLRIMLVIWFLSQPY